MTTAAPTRFIPYIHIIRGIAPILVIWSHLVGLWIYESGTTWDPWTHFYNYVMLPFHVYHGGGHLGVILFFLISGYVISHVSERENRLEFVIKRIFRIIPPLIAAVAVLALANAILMQNGMRLVTGTNSTALSDYLLTATLLDRFVYSTSYSLSVTWTLVSEFYFYFFVMLLMPVMRTNPVRSTAILLMMYAALSAPAIMHPYFRATAANTIYIPVFVIGRLIFLIDFKRITPYAAGVLGAAATVLFASVHEALFPGELFGGQIIKAFTYPFAIIIFLCAREIKINKIPEPLKFFGDISYSMYLLHIPVGFFILITCTASLGFTSSLILAFCATVFASWLSYKMVEKPSQSLARAIVRKIGFQLKS